MCGVTVVDAGRSQFTCLGHDAYINDQCLGFRHDYSLFYQLPNSNLLTHNMLFSREKPLVKTMAPGSYFYHILKSKNNLLQFYLLYFILCFLFIYLSLRDLILAINRQGIDKPSLGASICYFCVGTSNKVLCGSPTGLINLVLN